MFPRLIIEAQRSRVRGQRSKPEVADEPERLDGYRPGSHDGQRRIEQPFEHRVQRALDLFRPDRQDRRRPPKGRQMLRKQTRAVRAGRVGRRKLRGDEHHASLTDDGHARAAPHADTPGRLKGETGHEINEAPLFGLPIDAALA